MHCKHDEFRNHSGVEKEELYEIRKYLNEVNGGMKMVKFLNNNQINI